MNAKTKLFSAILLFAFLCPLQLNAGQMTKLLVQKNGEIWEYNSPAFNLKKMDNNETQSTLKEKDALLTNAFDNLSAVHSDEPNFGELCKITEIIQVHQGQNEEFKPFLFWMVTGTTLSIHHPASEDHFSKAFRKIKDQVSDPTVICGYSF